MLRPISFSFTADRIVPNIDRRSAIMASFRLQRYCQKQFLGTLRNNFMLGNCDTVHVLVRLALNNKEEKLLSDIGEQKFIG